MTADSRSVVSLTTEGILHFRAGGSSVPLKHLQEATRLHRRKPRVRRTTEPTEDKNIGIDMCTML